MKYLETETDQMYEKIKTKLVLYISYIFQRLILSTLLISILIVAEIDSILR